MLLEQFLTLNVILVGAVASPGPALVYAVRTALAEGRWAGFVTGLGLATMASLWTLLALAGLGRLMTLFPTLHTVLSIAGAVWLIYVAVGMWRSARSGPGRALRPTAIGAFLGGFLVNASNPKVLLLAVAILVAVFPDPVPRPVQAAIVVNHFSIEMIFYGALSLVAGSRGFATTYVRSKLIVDRAAGAVIAAMGIALLMGRVAGVGPDG